MRIPARLAAVIVLAGALTAGCDVHTPTGPGALASITVTPNPTLAIDATQLFTAVGRDAEGTVVAISPAPSSARSSSPSSHRSSRRSAYPSRPTHSTSAAQIRR